MTQFDNIAQRMRSIQPFHVMELLARARALESQGRSVIHMEIGEPDFTTPQPVVNAAMKFIQAGEVKYTSAAGLPELRSAISKYYKDRYGACVSPERIFITPGSSGALLLAMGVLVSPGDEVLVTDPGYPCNKNFILFAGGTPKLVPVDSKTKYQMSPEIVSANWSDKTVSAIIASPSNPTGTTVEPQALKEIIEIAKNHGRYIVLDEIYNGLSYDEKVASGVSISDEIFLVGSFSKFWGMTGWRIGWLVVPDLFVRDIEKLAQNLFISASAPAQFAALSAFDPLTLEIVEQRRQEFKVRRDFLFSALTDLGFVIPLKPDGAFYLYANCSRFTADSYRFCWDILEQVGVAITPGIDFGSFQPERHVRFSYTTSLPNLQEGIDRLKKYLL